MGSERVALVVAALALAACARDATPPSAPSGALASKRHVQIVRATPRKQLEEIFARFDERNGRGWTHSGLPEADVDPIRLVVRRAQRLASDIPDRNPSEADARATATAFLAKNADLLGLGPDDVEALDAGVVPAPTQKLLGGAARHVVHFLGKRPMKGYEGFDTLASHFDIALIVARDGEVRAVLNGSRIHPRLGIDTVPKLGPDDPKLLVNVLGRKLFAVVDDPRRRGANVRELERVPLGQVFAADVKRVTLHVHVSVGPMLAYVSYILAYAVDVEREGLMFRFIVDADTGDVLVDASAPVIEPAIAPDDD